MNLSHYLERRLRYLSEWVKTPLHAIRLLAKRLPRQSMIAFEAFWLQILLMIANVIYTKKARECLGCGWKGWRFLPDWGSSGVVWDTLCPKCGAFSRYHLYFWWFKNCFKVSGGVVQVLEIAPKPCSIRFFQYNDERVSYLSVDLSSALAMQLHDITNLGLKSNSFDLVLCSHVLEHVMDDVQGMREISRVMRSGGVAILQVPVDWMLDRSIEYGCPRVSEDDHLRTYGRDFMARSQTAGFRTELFDIARYVENEALSKHGIKAELLILGYKD